MTHARLDETLERPAARRARRADSQDLARGPRHGYAIARFIEDTTGEAVLVEEGSLYPALYRMERRGWIEAEWGTSELGRRAKLYASPRPAARNWPPNWPPGGGSPPACRKVLFAR